MYCLPVAVRVHVVDIDPVLVLALTPCVPWRRVGSCSRCTGHGIVHAAGGGRRGILGIRRVVHGGLRRGVNLQLSVRGNKSINLIEIVLKKK